MLQNIDLLIDVTLLSSKLAIVFAGLFSNNLFISRHIKEEHIIRIISTSEGYQGEYLLVLQNILKTQGKLIKKNQDIVMRYIMENRNEYIPFDNKRTMENIRDMNDDAINYYINLISVLAICGQSENTFGQSVRYRIAAICNKTNASLVCANYIFYWRYL